VICDCEGFEDQLLRPDQAPQLLRTTVLVECHECKNFGVDVRVHERFERSHDIAVIQSKPRTAADLPLGVSLSEEEAAEALNERQVPMKWYYMTPRT
jgi:hypothetical protein